MKLQYFDPVIPNGIIKELFHLSFSDEDVPFKSLILPVGYITICYIFTDNCQKIFFNNTEIELNKLMLTGQFSEAFTFKVSRSSHSYGVNLHPTAFYKITGQNLSQLTNTHQPLELVSKQLTDLLTPIFEENENNTEKLTQKIKKTLTSLHLKTDEFTDQIDCCINFIFEKEGMLNTTDLLEKVNFSQKTLETRFKKVIGLTPGKYIRLHRFLNLMRKYESGEIDLKDLIYSYNYYDYSHFNKDFKHFMNQSPKDYFKADNAFLNEYLSK